MKKIFSPGEVAQMLMVSPVTVRSWANNGDLKSVTTAGGHRRFRREDILKFAEERQLHIEIDKTIGQRILIVDDDEQLAILIKEFLSGYPEITETAIANDGFTAGSLVYTFNPTIILLDLMLPGLDGFQVCKKLKRQQTTKDIRVIAMTGHPTDEFISTIMKAGAECCLSKPFELDQVIDALKIDQTTNDA